MGGFKVDRNWKVIIDIEAAKLVPELRSLSEEELLYVILVADYVDGPFRKQPPEERRIMAVRRVYGKDKVLKETEKIKNEIYEKLDGKITQVTSSDDMADILINKAMGLNQDQLDMDKKYYKKFKKELGGKLAAKFHMIENRINLMINLQIAASVPVIE